MTKNASLNLGRRGKKGNRKERLGMGGDLDQPRRKGGPSLLGEKSFDRGFSAPPWKGWGDPQPQVKSDRRSTRFGPDQKKKKRLLGVSTKKEANSD